MSKKDPKSQFDLFVPLSTEDLPLRDTQETMERPFFSLAKRKRLKPIDYVSPDQTIYVRVFATPQFGMATIWDADILIWAASHMKAMRRAGINDVPRTLRFQPYDLLKKIGRDTGGYQYKLLRDALARLQSTTIQTNIRPIGRKKDRQFSWIEGWTDDVNPVTGHSQSMSLTVAEWFYEGVANDKNLLAIDPAYFALSGGRERWLYRVARKHAGGAGQEGFAISMPTLFDKSGAEGTYRRFKFEMQALVMRNTIPGYDVFLETGAGSEPLVRMIRQGFAVIVEDTEPKPIAGPGLTDKTLALCRKHFPGWDVYATKSEYDQWLTVNSEKVPEDYQKAFYGFMQSKYRLLA